MIGLAWPWLLLAAPAPWLVPHLLPAARPGVPAALWIPFFAAVAPQARGLDASRAGADAARRPALAAWAALLVAAARPQWQGADVYAWPLSIALVLAGLAAWRASRPPQPRGRRRLPARYYRDDSR